MCWCWCCACVNLYYHREFDPVNVFESHFDVGSVMALDPCSDEIIVRGKHDEPIACRLRMQAREKGIDLRWVYIVVLFDFLADIEPYPVELFAIHFLSSSIRFLPCALVFKFSTV